MIHRLTIDAFAASPAVTATLQEARHSQSLSKCRMELRDGRLAGAIRHYADHATPQLVIVEEDDPLLLIQHLEQLADVCAANTRVVVIGAANDIQLYRTLLARGISDYLPQPVSSRQIIDSITTLFSDSRTAPRGRVIAFWGARGGTGSSCLAQNTAWLLGRQYREPVVYIDLDLSFGTSLLAYNIEAKQTVADALRHPERLDEVLMQRCMVEYDENLQILTSSGDCRADVLVTAASVETLIDLAQRLSRVVLLDLPHLWADWTRQCLAAADEVVITAGPDFASLRECKTLLDLLAPSRSGASAPKLVLNKVDSTRKHQLTTKDFADSIGLAPVVSIPFDPALFGEATNVGQMIGEIGKTHRVTQSLEMLAEAVAGKPATAGKNPTKRGGGMWQWLKK